MQSPHSLIISDLHLSAERNDLNKAFTRFCQTQAQQAQALYILGDLADAWVGDDDDSSTAQLINDNLRDLVDAGTQVFLMTGNRDFLMGQALASHCGLTLLPDPSLHTIHGHRVLLMHGDSLCTGDAEYMAFRAQIQNPAATAALLAKPIAERRQIAQMLRSQSKSANSNKAEDIMDVAADEVLKALQTHQVDTLIHGHTHRPAVHTISLDEAAKAKRYVLGDWDQRGWQIRIDTNGIALSDFALEA